MIRIFNTNLFKKKKTLQREDSKKIIKDNISIEDIIKIYEEYSIKSLKENKYYIQGSNYFKSLIDNKEYDLLRFFIIPNAKIIDESNITIPLELGYKLEEIISNKNIRLGIHQSDSIINNPLEDNTLISIMNKGLINNGSIMQGQIYTHTIQPSKTIRNAEDIIFATRIIKSSFRNSKGSLLIGLPRNIINIDYDLIDDSYANIIYDYDENGMCYIKPEYIIGYISTENNMCKFYSKEEVLRNTTKSI